MIIILSVNNLEELPARDELPGVSRKLRIDDLYGRANTYENVCGDYGL